MINAGFSNGFQSNAFYMDLSKAFDCVNQELLLLNYSKLVYQTHSIEDFELNENENVIMDSLMKSSRESNRFNQWFGKKSDI